MNDESNTISLQRAMEMPLLELASLVRDPDSSELVDSLMSEMVIASMSKPNEEISVLTDRIMVIISISPVLTDSILEYAQMLIDDGKLDASTAHALLGKDALPESLKREAILLLSRTYLPAIFDSRTNLTTEDIDLFAQNYINFILGERDDFTRWRNLMGFPSLCASVLEHKNSSSRAKDDFKRLLFIWSAVE